MTDLAQRGSFRKMPELREQAKGRWRSILPLLGVPTTFLDGKQRACPMCGGKDRARFDDKEGFGTWICNQCGAGDGVKLAMLITGMSFPDTANRVRELLPEATFVASKPARDDEKCKRDMREVWSASVPITGTLAEAYLRSRGIEPPYPAVLRFMPRMRATKHELEYLPAMIAKVDDADGHGTNIHRTFLHDGDKAYRAMMPGPLPAGCAIRLGPIAPTLGVAEGIETALSVSRRFGVPCWSLISANNLGKWEPPPEVTQANIYGDNDASYTGHSYSYSLAHRLVTKPTPIKAQVFIPETVGTDWADQ